MALVEIRYDTSQAKRATKDLTKDTKKLQDAVRGSQGALEKQGRAAGAAAGATTKFGASAKLAAPGVRALGAAVKAALGPVGLLLSAAGAMTQAFGVLAKQDFAEAKVRTLGVNSAELTKRLKGVSRELNGQASVVELTAAAYDVASAGFANAADNAKILKAASQGATGGFSDINTVADAATSVLNAYGKTADEVSAIVDGFIQTQNDGKIIIGQYAANIAKVSPVAAALGIELAEVNAAVAQITAGGTNAEMTFTGLKTAFAQIASGNVGKEFKKYGVEINAATIKSDGLAGTLEKIKKTGADAGTVIKAFGTEAGPAVLALLENTEKYNKLLENQKKAQGAAAKAAFEASDTIKGSLNRLRVAFENLFADGGELGDLLKLIFKGAAVTVEVLGVTINNLLAPFRAVSAAVSEVGKAIGQALGMEGVNVAFEMQEAYKGVLDVFSQVSDFIVGLGVRFGQFLGGIITGTNQVKTFVKQNLIGGFADAFNGIKQKMMEFYNGLPGWAKFLIEGAAKAANIAGNMISGAMGKIKQFAQTTIAAGQGFKADEKARVANAQQQQAAAANGIAPTGGGLGKTKLSDAQKEELRRQQEAQRLADAAYNQQQKQQESFENQVLKLQEKQAIQRAIIDGNEEEVRNAFLLSNLQKQHGEENGQILYQNELIGQALDKRVEKHKQMQDEQKKEAEKIKELFTQIGMSIKDGVVEMIGAAIDKTKSLREVALNLVNKLKNMLLDVAINFAMFGTVSGTGSGGGLLGKLFNFGGKRAKGGPVARGKGYIVGENGPEYFQPGQSGEIVPNDFLKQVMQQYGFFGMMMYPRLRMQRYGNQPMNAMEMRMFPRGFAGFGGAMSGGMGQSTGNPMLDIYTGRGSFAGTQARAKGGPVLGGAGYTVGERGPEMFIPRGGGGGGVSANIVVNVNADGGMQSQGDPSEAKRLGEAIGIAVRQELIKQKRPGGLLS